MIIVISLLSGLTWSGPTKTEYIEKDGAVYIYENGKEIGTI